MLHPNASDGTQATDPTKSKSDSKEWASLGVNTIVRSFASPLWMHKNKM